MLRILNSQKLDLYTKVVTPENIEFEYALAGPFQRLPAYVADLIIWNVAFWAIIFVITFAAGLLGITGMGSVVGFLLLVTWFLLRWFYGIFFEAVYNGRTPGKMLFKLRVISTDGRPINGLQAGLRNLLRTADVNVLLSIQMFEAEAPPVYLFPTMIVGLTTMMVTKRMQRIGDLAADTMVISEQPRYSPWNLQPDDVRAFGLAELIPPTYQVSSSLAQAVGLYMENRRRLSIGRREEIAARIARPLIRQFEMLPDTSNDLLLCALYVRVFMSEEQQAKGIADMRRVTTASSLRPPVATQSTLGGNSWP